MVTEGVVGAIVVDSTIYRWKLHLFIQGNKDSLLQKEEIEELVQSTPFSSREITQLLVRYGQIIPPVTETEVSGLTLDQMFTMPEFSGNLYIRPIATTFLDETKSFILPYQFIQLCAILSDKASAKRKRLLLYEYLDINRSSLLSYEEIFRLFKHLYDHSLSDDNLLLLTHQILTDPNLSNPGNIPLKQLDKLISDSEILHRMTITFQFSGM